MTNEEWQEENDRVKRLLQASIPHEQNKRSIESQMAKRILQLENESKELRAENAKLRSILDIATQWVGDTLEAKERLFKIDASLLDREQLSEYITVARYMEGKGRPSLADEFWERMRSLNI